MSTQERDDQGEGAFEDEAARNGGEVKVEVTYVNTTVTVDFRAARTATLNQVFDVAYSKLTETRRPGDKYFCVGGLDLGPYLGLTLEELHKRKICRDRKYEIAAETGGAKGANPVTELSIDTESRGG